MSAAKHAAHMLLKQSLQSSLSPDDLLSIAACVALLCFASASASLIKSLSPSLLLSSDWERILVSALEVGCAHRDSSRVNSRSCCPGRVFLIRMRLQLQDHCLRLLSPFHPPFLLLLTRDHECRLSPPPFLASISHASSFTAVRDIFSNNSVPAA